jgi:hypothetical protein
VGTRSDEEEPGDDVDADLHATRPVKEVDTDGRETNISEMHASDDTGAWRQ